MPAPVRAEIPLARRGARKIASKRYRQPLDGRCMLTDLDHALLEDLFFAGMADTKALLVFAASHGVTRLQHRPRRLTELWRHMVVSRIDPNLTHLLGSKTSFYCFETGRGQLTYESRRDYRQLPDDVRARILKDSAPIRRATLEYLVQRGWAADLVESRLESNANAICRFASRDEASQVPHRLLGAEALAILCLGARTRGLAVRDRRPDGDLAFAVQVNGADARIEPDAFFVLGTTGIAVEVETGSAGRKSLTTKIHAYLALYDRGLTHIVDATGAAMEQFCVLFYCATVAHAALIERLLAAEAHPGAQFFRIVTQRAMGLAITEHGEPILRDMLVRNALVYGSAKPVLSEDRDERVRRAHARLCDAWQMRTPLFSYLQDRVAAPIFRRKTADGFVSVPLVAPESSR